MISGLAAMWTTARTTVLGAGSSVHTEAATAIMATPPSTLASSQRRCSAISSAGRLICRTVSGRAGTGTSARRDGGPLFAIGLLATGLLATGLLAVPAPAVLGESERDIGCLRHAH